MKNLYLKIFLFLIVSLNAQNIEGDWYGNLEITKVNLEIILHINQLNNVLKSTMDSPAQGAMGLPTDFTSFENNVLKFAINQFEISYEGTLNSDGNIVGKFKQGTFIFSLTFFRDRSKAIPEKPAKKQDPKAPFDYKIQDVTFENKKENITLAGTLTIPNQNKKKYPVVILISGSGPQNRNEEIEDHKPFWVIADYLTRNGIAVLRYDDRGVGQSTGDFSSSTSFDFANDVFAAVDFVKQIPEIDAKKITLIGHSEGGLIAPIVAANNKDIHSIVSLAGPGLKGDQLLIEQNNEYGKLQQLDQATLDKNKILNQSIYNLYLENSDLEIIKTKLLPIYITIITEVNTNNAMSQEEISATAKQQIEQSVTKWLQTFINFDPEKYLSKTKCPVLILNGAKDFQVIAKSNVEAIENILKKYGNKKFKSIIYPNLNHLFQQSETGDFSEYATNEETFNLTVLEDIKNWLNQQYKN